MTDRRLADVDRPISRWYSLQIQDEDPEGEDV